MEGLVAKINELKSGEIALIISSRLKEFENVLDEELFSELCFCLMTANFKADRCIELQKLIGEGFHDWKREKLASFLKEKGHRFWPQRAERIVLAREHKRELERVRSEGDRDWLVENVKGLGMKEASHFLRNVGFGDVAIIDFHIVDLLVDEGILERPKGMNTRRYLEIEDLLREIAKRVGMSLGELDLYLWYLETGKVLK